LNSFNLEYFAICPKSSSPVKRWQLYEIATDAIRASIVLADFPFLIR